MLHPSINPGLLYGYIPTTWICALFVGLFSTSTLTHLVQAIYFRLWWLLPTIVLGGFGEIIGWSGRLWSSKTFKANDIKPYLMQISSTIIAPTPIVAANFIILGILIKYLGDQYSRLSARSYGALFIFVDIIALIVQAIGGASASRALQSGQGNPNDGGHVMLAGIIIQLAAIIVYVTLASEFLYRHYTDKPFRKSDLSLERGYMTRRVVLMVIGLASSTLFILIRAVYRTIELSNGWTGRIIRTQVFFNVLDGAMIVIALFSLNVCHPGFLLSRIFIRRIVDKYDSEGHSPIPTGHEPYHTGTSDNTDK